MHTLRRGDGNPDDVMRVTTKPTRAAHTHTHNGGEMPADKQLLAWVVKRFTAVFALSGEIHIGHSFAPSAEKRRKRKTMYRQQEK
jgi:hypothetical protein